MLSKSFKKLVLGRQEMVQCKRFFWHQTETCLLENLQIQKSFRLRCGSILFSMLSKLRFAKWVRFFEGNFIVKWVIFFISVYWLVDFLLQNLKIKKITLMMSTGRCGQYKNVCRNNILKKRIPNTRFWIIYISVEDSLFGDSFRAF